MSERIKLTPGRIEAATCPPGKQQVIVRDAEQPGLGLRVTAAGAKSYIFQGKLAGQVIRMTIGDIKTINLGAARDISASLRTQVRAGRDPRIVKSEATAADIAKRQKAKQHATPALEAWSEYIKARTSKWSERHKADHEDMSRDGGEKITRGRRPGMSEKKEPGILRPLLDLPLQEITRDRVIAWLDDEVPKRPTRTRLAASLLATFINWCSDRPAYRDQVHTDACTRIKNDLPKPKAKSDCLQREQLKLWFEHVCKLGNPVQAAYLQLSLLLGCRREELATMQWVDIDFRWNSIHIADKVEQDAGRTIPLTPYVKSVLLGLRAINNKPPSIRSLERLKAQGQNWEPSPWVFFSPTAKSGRIQEPRVAHNRALAAAGLPHITIHGLRRSFGTLAEWVECPAGVVAQIQGHKPSATVEKHYRVRPLDLLRMWHVKIEEWMLEQAELSPTQPHVATRAVA